MYVNEINQMLSHFQPTPNDRLLANMKKTLSAMDRPGFDYDGCDPENARRELEEQIRRMEE